MKEQVSLLPPLASVVVATIAAPLADHFISRGMDITLVRKVCQSIAFLAPAACMTIASATPNINPWVDVAILTAGIGLSSFALAGLVISSLWFLSQVLLIFKFSFDFSA
jgi:ACS family sodium-dependent inorganic phosphate cotransporter